MRAGFRKKVTAVFAAGALALAGLAPLTASAAYVDTERENWTTFTDAYAEAWDQEMAASQESGAVSAEIKLELGQYVRTMLCSILTTTGSEPMDLDWLESIGIQIAASKEESNIFDTAFGLCLNDTVLATLELPIDLGSDMVRFRVPEISENYLGAPFEFENEEAKQQWQRLKEVLNPEFLAELSADGDTVAELLKRYGDMLFDRMTDAASEEKTETVEGLEETFTVEEGRLYAADMAELILEMAKQARDDEQLKEMIENLGTFASQENFYEEYQQAMDKAISDMEADMPQLSELEDDGENYISSKIWLDAEGKCAGREFALVSDGEEEIQFAWLNIREGDQAALRMNFMSGEGGSDESIVLSGVGTITDGTLNGEYTVTSNAFPLLNIEVSDYDADAEMGDFDGTYKLSFAGAADDPQEGISPADFALIFDVEQRAEEKIENISMSLTMQDEILAALHLKSDENADLSLESGAGEGVVYDANDQEDMQKYAAEVNPETIIENCRKAGVPDEFITQIAGLITSMMQPTGSGTAQTEQSEAGTTQSA